MKGNTEELRNAETGTQGNKPKEKLLNIKNTAPPTSTVNLTLENKKTGGQEITVKAEQTMKTKTS